MAQKQPIIQSGTYVLFLLNFAFEPCENSFMEILLKDSRSMVVNSKVMALTIVLDTKDAQIDHYFLKIIFVYFRML